MGSKVIAKGDVMAMNATVLDHDVEMVSLPAKRDQARNVAVAPATPTALVPQRSETVEHRRNILRSRNDHIEVDDGLRGKTGHRRAADMLDGDGSR